MAGYNDDFTSPYGNHVNKYNNGVFSNYRFNITKFVAAPTRKYGYRDMVVRGFTSNITNETKNNVLREVEQIGTLGNNSTVLNDVVSVGTTPLSLAKISGGWAETRVVVDMVVRCEPINPNITLPTYDLLITGYSDPTSSFVIRDSYSNTYHPDTHLKFYINSIQKVTINTKRGLVTKMENLGVTTPIAFDSNANVAMRPEDIMSDINSRCLAQEYNGGILGVGLSAANDPITINRLHMIGKSYASDIVNSVVQGVQSATQSRMGLQNMFASGTSQSFVEATHFLHNNTLDTDLFLQALTEASPFDLMEGYTFNIDALQRLDRNFSTANVVYADVTEDARTQGELMLSTNDTMGLYEGTVMNAKVTELHNMIMALFTGYHLGHLELRIFNTVVTNELGQPVLTYKWMPTDNPGAISFGYGANLTDPAVFNRLNMAIDNFVKTSIDPKLSDHGFTQYEVLLKADMAGDTTIVASFDNEPPVIYRFATFADMAFTPMIANKDTKDAMSTNMSALANDVSTVASSAYGVRF
nr:MAG TPA: hypothetical protein [Caudoviricetes sp.]